MDPAQRHGTTKAIAGRGQNNAHPETDDARDGSNPLWPHSDSAFAHLADISSIFTAAGEGREYIPGRLNVGLDPDYDPSAGGNRAARVSGVA